VRAPSPWALIVLGQSRAGRLSRQCHRLLAHAAAIADRDAPRVIVFTGWSPSGGPSEAEQMLEAWPGRRDVELVVEPTARITAENASRTLPLLLERGIPRATVVCTTVHLPRVRALFPGLFASFGIRCDVHTAWAAPTPRSVAWELGALPLLRRQRRAAFAEARSARRG
jgi:hypothetical protein